MESTQGLRDLLNQLLEQFREFSNTMIDQEVLARAVDAVEDEVIKSYMRLPVDEDGKPINIGDYVYFEGELFKVTSILQGNYVIAARSLVSAKKIACHRCKRVELSPAKECFDIGAYDLYGEQAFKCSECGCLMNLRARSGVYTLHMRGVNRDTPLYCPECGRKVVRIEHV